MGENRRALIFGGIGLGLVLLLFGVKLLAGHGGGGGDITAPPLATTTLPGGGRVTTTTGPQASETFDVFTSRNPFRILVSASSAGGGTSTGSGGSSTGGGGATGGGSGTTDTTVNATGSGGAGEPGSGQTVSLIEIFDQNGRTARIRVGSTVYTAKAGEHFANNYQVTSLGDRCGDFLFGDSPFSLCVGEEIVK